MIKGIGCNVAGISFAIKDNPKVSSLRLPYWSELTLVADKDNKIDPMAVAIYSGAIRIGYVPRKVPDEVGSVVPQTWVLSSEVNNIQCRVFKSWYKDEHGVNDEGHGDLVGVKVVMWCESPCQINFEGERVYVGEDNQPYMSMTRFLDWLPNPSDTLVKWAAGKFKNKAEYDKFMIDVQERGNEMHKLCEDSLLGIKPFDLLQQYMQNQSMHLGLPKRQPRVEEQLFWEEARIAGTMDAILYDQFNNAILHDWKSGAHIRESHKFQVCCYARMAKVKAARVVLLNANTWYHCDEEEILRRSEYILALRKLLWEYKILQ